MKQVFKLRIPLMWHLNATDEIIQEQKEKIESVLLSMENVESLVLPPDCDIKRENDANTIYLTYTANIKT